MCRCLVLCIPESGQRFRPARAKSPEPTDTGISVLQKWEANTMEIQEFQAKALLARYAVACPKGMLATSADGAERAVRQLGPGPVLVKAQVLAGDRAHAGGIHVARSPELGRAAAAGLLGGRLVTAQTGPGGELVKRVLIEASVNSVRDLYLAMMVDAASGALLLIAGRCGGTGIEDRADGALETLLLGAGGELDAGDIAGLCRRLTFTDREIESCREIIGKLHRAFIELDASLIEINPLALTQAGDAIALDAKIVLDDNALFRHPELAELRDQDEIDQVELSAQRHQLNFMQLDGDIGVIVNGAGLALATLDMIREAGGRPANFMDIRTTAKSLDIAHGIGLVLDNPRVKVLLLNVYGGGMQPCDTIIEGLGIAVRRKGRALPVVLRFTGNNEDLARLRLANFNLPATECTDMWQAVTLAVATAKGRK
jgi:succinyl-CoA synthetase beta subunit